MVHHVTKPQIALVERDKDLRSPAEQKLDQNLLDAIRAGKPGRVVAGVPHLQAAPIGDAGDVIEVDIHAKMSPELLDKIRELGGTVEYHSPENHLSQDSGARAFVPKEALKPLASRSDVRAITQAYDPTAQYEPNSEGDIAHAANLVRTKFTAQGAGVKIGVISDSIDDGHDAEESAFTTGVLNSDLVTVLRDSSGAIQDGAGRGEGLAMLEIVHAIAPAAGLYFATGNGSPWHMADNIRALRDAGCQIIVDDLIYPDESPFQDDVIGRAIDEVSASGVLYFSSAGNYGNVSHHTSMTWEGDFHDGGPVASQLRGREPAARVHVFEGMVTLNTVDGAIGTKSADLFWSDPLGHSSNDYDMFVVDSGGNVVQHGDRIQNGTQDPYEHVDGIHSGQSIMIVKKANAQSRFLHLEITGGRLRHSTGGSTRGHNANGAANSFSVAAIRAPNPPSAFNAGAQEKVEEFSSDGPRRVFFSPDGSPITPGDFTSSGGLLLQKPDIAAADGVSTTFSPPSKFNPFLGTSAAAPQAAAIAALLLSCAPRTTAAQIRAVLERTAIPIEGASPNVTAGHGIVMANAAAQAICAVSTVDPATVAPQADAKGRR